MFTPEARRRAVGARASGNQNGYDHGSRAEHDPPAVLLPGSAPFPSFMSVTYPASMRYVQPTLAPFCDECHPELLSVALESHTTLNEPECP